MATQLEETFSLREGSHCKLVEFAEEGSSEVQSFGLSKSARKIIMKSATDLGTGW